MDSIRVSEAPDPGSIPGEATRVRNKKQESKINNLIVLESFRSSRSRFSAAADGEATRVRIKKEETRSGVQKKGIRTSIQLSNIDHFFLPSEE